MSAFICSPEHIAALAAFAASCDSVIYEWQGDNAITSAQHIARGLLQENIRSVNARYPHDNGIVESLPGSGYTLDQLNDMVDEQAERYFFTAPPLSLIAYLKMAACLNYQSCETDNWETTLAHRQLQWIISAVHRKLDGYDSAPWEYRDDKADCYKAESERSTKPILLSTLMS